MTEPPPPPAPGESNLLALRLTQAAAVFAFAAVGYMLYLHGSVVFRPWPVEYREGIFVVTTDLLLHGQNPYVLENLPQYTNTYGLGYHLVVLPFAWLFGNGMQVHRVVSALALFGCCGAICWFLRREGAPRLVSAIAAIIFYGLLAAHIAPMQPFASPAAIFAQPNALGLLVLLLSILIPVRADFSRASLLASGLLALYGLMTKQYYVVGLPIIAAYVFSFRSKELGLAAGLLFLLAVGALIAVMAYLCPAWFPITFVASKYSVNFVPEHLYAQLRVLLITSPGLIVATLLTAASSLRGGVRWRLDPLWFVLICCCVVLWPMGGNTGASMQYFNQLLIPWLLLIACRQLARQRSAIIAGLILLDVLILVRTLPALPQRHDEVWTQWSRTLAGYKNIYATPPLAWMLREQGKPVIDGGHVEVFPRSTEAPIWPWAQAYFNHYQRWYNRLNEAVERQEFDLIVLPYFDVHPMRAFIRQGPVWRYYREIGRLPLPMDWSPHYVGVMLVPREIPLPLESP